MFLIVNAGNCVNFVVYYSYCVMVLMFCSAVKGTVEIVLLWLKVACGFAVLTDILAFITALIVLSVAVIWYLL